MVINLTEIKILLVMFLCFSGGIIVSGGVFAFITIIGVVPSIANKTKSEKYIRYFEECIMFGGIFGCCSSFIDYNFKIGKNLIGQIFIVIFFLCVGVFYGVLAVSLAETLDVIPVLSRRTKIKNNILIMMVAIAIGKFLGSLLFYFVPGFQIK